MAQRRMISKAIHQDGRFLSLSPTSKILYDDLVLYADDDGFCPDTSLINLMDKATEDNYKELEQAGFIVNIDGVYLIVDWLNTQLLNHYSRTSYLALSSKVFIKIDFKYTINEKDENIALSLDDWVERKNRSRQINLKSLQQQRLKDMVNQKLTDSNPTVNKMFTKGSPSIDKNSIDKSRLEQDSTDQQRAAKGSKDIKYIHSSSNGGMGEVSSTPNTSTKDNNATRDNENERIVNDATTSNDEEVAESLFDYLNAVAGTNIPTDNQRLMDMFNKLIANGYEVDDVKSGIDDIVNTAKEIPQYNTSQTLSQLLVQHLAEYTRTALEKNDND